MFYKVERVLLNGERKVLWQGKKAKLKLLERHTRDSKRWLRLLNNEGEMIS